MTFIHARRTLFGVIYLSLVLTVSYSQEVTTIDQNGLIRIIHERNGRPLLLNIWATWCEPCREEFPDLNQLHAEYAQQEFDIIAISVDYPDEIESKIKPFLKSMKSKLPVYVADFPSQDDFFALFDKNWTGGIPMTFLYDSNGELRQYLLGKQTHKDFVNALEAVRNPR